METDSTTTEIPTKERESGGAWVRIAHVVERLPWLIPTISFVTGVVGFVMVKRGAGLARYVAVAALAGWLWLLIEPLVRRYLESRRSGIGKFVSNFLTQSLQQEVLFFSLPFLFGALQRDIGQIIFIAIAAGAALLTALDPLYERWIAARAATRLLFHAYCSLIAAVVVVPMVVHLSLDEALPLALAAVSLWLLLTSPMSLRSLRSSRHRWLWVACSVLAPALIWALRAHVPPAGLAVTQAVITQSIDDLTPGPRVRTLTTAELASGVVAFAAIRAPSGVAQSIVFEWRHRGDVESISSEIRGGNEQGWRTYSRKQSFPANALGRWIVDVKTPQGQLLKRMQFTVQP
ncbi:DUF2914 domain-containing protein [Steroidobacter sp. S1-65]|uniref:DUF2914 domain-containing protein n=1 Tax=Steroidobacter gossypii TaxID=2805490 RepID=A0ABS1X0X1_9GAMM|nr:DUF2914 domain-containing protein [Steroidobacter gossypii]MBM0106899.1 DUF2914 domain-containing protein [Steroidobacter gossypii]